MSHSTLDDFLASLEADRKTWSPIKRYFKDKAFLGRNGWYWLTNPHKLLPETAMYCWRTVKCFIQRGRRGYSDCDLWDFDHYLCEMLVAALTDIKKHTMHHPAHLTEKEWDDILEELIEGFARINNREKEEDYFKYLEDKERLMLLFGNWVSHLWL